MSVHGRFVQLHLIKLHQLRILPHSPNTSGNVGGGKGALFDFQDSNIVNSFSIPERLQAVLICADGHKKTFAEESLSWTEFAPSRHRAKNLWKWEEPELALLKFNDNSSFFNTPSTFKDKKNSIGSVKEPVQPLSCLTDFLQPAGYVTDDIHIREECSDSLLQRIQFQGNLNIIKREQHPVTILKHCDAYTSTVRRTESMLPAVICSRHSKFCTKTMSCKSVGSVPMQNNDGRPSVEQLEKMKAALIEVYPGIFKTAHPYGLYHDNILFENNYWGKSIVRRGKTMFAMEIAKLRLATFKYSRIRLIIKRITSHPDEGVIRMHWQVTGISTLKYLVTLKEEAATEVFEGINTFLLGPDGLVHKLSVDRVMPDMEMAEEKKPGNLALKLAILLGLVPKHDLNDFLSLFSKRRSILGLGAK
ncbi:hypothetical protein ACJMK2_040020 [Sinanodonta woodiana]|uniref:Uncharacterized protein n=1 Tax=Sinanodonta woodiana TaxID=1069815 RepID=A0ABD3WH70_SINWO